MDSTALILNLDQNNPMPVYEQILNQIIQLIDMGTLRAGTHLPPTRTLARKLDVNRSTVYRAYQELWAQGYIKSRPGSFSTVRHRSVSAAGKDRKHAGILSWDKLSTPRSRDIYKTYLSHVNKYPEIDPSRVIALTDLAADRQLCPVEDFRKCVREVLLRKGSEILSYGEPAGSRQTDAHYQLDLSYTQNFPIGDRFNILLRGEVFNVTDNQTGYNMQPMENSAGFAEPQDYIRPRRFQVTAAFQF